MINGLPERLRELRHKNGLSQKTVAERLNISPSIIAGYESGYRTPSTDVLLSLSYLYSCSTDYLLGKDKHLNTQLNIDGLSNDQIEAIAKLIDTIRKETPKRGA